MTARVADITSADWSPLVGSPGEVVENLADIEQCLDIIITTSKGSDPHRPLFGCDAWQYLDVPVNVGVPKIIRAVVDALEMWEPRIAPVAVGAFVDSAGITVTVTWQPAQGGEVRKTEVIIGNNAA